MSKFILSILLCAGVAFSIGAVTQKTTLPPTKQILFICTGNFYRSRLAEALFNQKARAAHLEWSAISRGLRMVSSQHGISPLAKRELLKRGVPPKECRGAPQVLTKEDLGQSDYIILMNEAEHRPLLEAKFPGRDEGKIHYWHIADAGNMTPAKACQTISKAIDELLQKFQR